MFKHDFDQNGIFKKFSGAPVNPLSATDVYTRFDPPKTPWCLKGQNYGISVHF